MSSSIELEEPFKSKWRKGYLQTHPNGRKYVCLYNSKTDRTIISYARYLYSVKVGREIPSDIEVDHRDGDETNDNVDNLRPMTKDTHRMKTRWCENPYASSSRMQCPQCGEWFERPERYVRDKKNQGQSVFHCSRSCSTKAQMQKSAPTPAISADTIATIRRLKNEGKSSYAISEEVSVSRNTVLKYWK